MSVCRQVVKDFNTYPATVATVAELLAKSDSVCVLLGNRCAVATTWDSDISAIARKVELDPKYEDGSLRYLCWKAGSTVDKPVVAETITITTKGKNRQAKWASSKGAIHRS